MMLVFKFCKEEEIGKQNVSRFLAGSSCFKSDQASNPHPRVPQVFPTQAKDTPRLGCLHPYPGALPGFSESTPVCPLQGALTDRELPWGKAGGNGVIVREIRPVGSVLTMRLQLLFLLQNPSVSFRENYRVWSPIKDRDSGLFLGLLSVRTKDSTFIISRISQLQAHPSFFLSCQTCFSIL